MKKDNPPACERQGDSDESTVREGAAPPTTLRVPTLSWLDAEGRHSVVVDRPTLVGSASKAGIVIADRSVSRVHAELDPKPDGLWVRDLGSLNGTLVHGIRVREACVPPGGRMRLGAIEFSVSLADGAPPERWLSPQFGELFGDAPAMRELFAQLARVAPTGASVLIQGETGTGKELCARAIHDASPRRAMPFVVIDCAALPESLLESELFGHARGAFTGAVGARAGAFEAADGGSIFLDEVGELPLTTQPKLLRVLESRTVRRIGETPHRRVDVRIVSATHRDLLRMVTCGAFREDLYFRLAVLPVRLPALRERDADIPPLLSSFLGRAALDVYGEALLSDLCRLPWLGNVRELRTFAERTLALGADAALALTRARGEDAATQPAASEREGAPPEVDPSVSFKAFRERWLDRGEAEYVKQLLSRHDRNVTAAAREAGLNRSHLYRLIKKHNV